MTTSATAAQPVTVEDYAHALEMWPSAMLQDATNLLIVPTWLEGEDRFWYRLEHRDGHEFILVDAATGERRPAFDHDLVAAALSADAGALPIEDLHYDADAVVVVASGETEAVRIERDGSSSPAPLRVTKGFAGPGGREAFVRDHDLWVREADGSERRLTADGVEHYGWAEAPDNDYDRLGRIGRDNAGLPNAMQGVFWAPEGDRLFVMRVDERSIPAYPYYENIRPDGDPVPQVHHIRRKLFGDAEDTRWEWHVVDVRSGERVRVEELPDGLYIQPWHAWWTPSGTVLALVSNSAQDAAGLVEIDTATGAVRIVHLEHDHMYRLNDIWFNDDNVHYLPERGAFLWYSQQDGWGHLYLIDIATGDVRQLTSGEWVVQDLLRVTAAHAFFTAGGVTPGRNPYHRVLFRVDLDGAANAGLVCLTPEDADHAFPAVPQGMVRHEWGTGPADLRTCIAPSGRYFVDNISRVDLPTVTLLRDADGRTITELARADISGLTERGWTFPETFCVKAADGETDMWGVLLKPRRFDESESYPIMERIYGGHQVLTQPRSFLEGVAGAFMFGMHALADLGFVIVVTDGPGTPLRSRAFRDLTWDTDDRFGLASHRAAIENLAATRPWMDLTRVGVNGHSSGGYTSLMCMLRENDFYSVAVSSSPALGADGSQAWISEAHFGRPDFGDGRRVRNHPTERTPSHRRWDPAEYVDRLRGKLLLMWGDIDQECEPAQFMQFVGKLAAAGKSVDLQVMAGQSHYYTTLPYYQKRMWDYFLEHLQGREPLRHHVFDVTAGERLWAT